MEVYLWQRMISPHMSALAEELARLGVRVFYCAEEDTHQDRKSLGWVVPNFRIAKLKKISSNSHAAQICREAAVDAVHLCQGIRGNGYVSSVQSELRKLNRSYWVMMETVDERGLFGKLKRIVYWYLFRSQRKNISGVLAIGSETPSWIFKIAPFISIFPFAYFPERFQNQSSCKGQILPPDCTNLIFVGQIIPRKNLGLLLEALEGLDNDIHLTIIGTGSEERALRKLASRRLNGMVSWLGVCKQSDVPSIISEADALILPSLHDGWGAVVTEAISVGTPSFCSHKCGASELCRVAPGCGVFAADDIDSLRNSLNQISERGVWSKAQRSHLINWAERISPESGARYLFNIVLDSDGQKALRPPWKRAS